LADHAGTRWLTAFFLPHMVLPGDPLLVVLRVAGSVALVLGLALFLVCAAQVYAAKLTRHGVVLGGAYAWIRHPQYACLALAGAGLAVLWPRFLSAVLWVVMVMVYYLLALDEERRMIAAYPDAYRGLRSRTGMFLPPSLERRCKPSSGLGRMAMALGFTAAALAVPFLLRAYTVRHLGLWSGPRDTAALAILPEDGMMIRHRMGELLELEPVRSRMAAGRRYLVYLLPPGYLMQGLIADTGGDWKLYRQHRTPAMILDWVVNPFGHLRGHHHGAMAQGGAQGAAGGALRRLIFVSVQGAAGTAPADLLAIGARRVPEFMVDADMHSLDIREIRPLPGGTGWGTVPPPAF
jgi:protein-S-isoprenylcysteine O-methyltransferase Ste14